MVVTNGIAIAASLVLSTAGTSGALELSQPSAENTARWEVDYGETRCRLLRHFGAGGGDGRLEIQRDWSFGGYSWILVGENLPDYTSATPVVVTLSPSLASHRFQTNPHKLDLRNMRGLGWTDTDSKLVDALRGNDRIRVTGAKKLAVTIDLPNASSALQALETCDDDLIAGWGFDPAQQRSIAVQVKPSNYPGRWVTNNDYPREDFVRKNEGLTTFLLSVGIDGGVTGCRIVGSSGFPSLDKRTCELLNARAAFAPAKDSSGRPVASFYINRVWWQVPR